MRCSLLIVINGCPGQSAEFPLCLAPPRPPPDDGGTDGLRVAQVWVGHVQAASDHLSAERAQGAYVPRVRPGRGLPPPRWPPTVVHRPPVQALPRSQSYGSTGRSAGRRSRRVVVLLVLAGLLSHDRSGTS